MSSFVDIPKNVSKFKKSNRLKYNMYCTFANNGKYANE